MFIGFTSERNKPLLAKTFQDWLCLEKRTTPSVIGDIVDLMREFVSYIPEIEEYWWGETDGNSFNLIREITNRRRHDNKLPMVDETPIDTDNLQTTFGRE